MLLFLEALWGALVAANHEFNWKKAKDEIQQNIINIPENTVYAVAETVRLYTHEMKEDLEGAFENGNEDAQYEDEDESNNDDSGSDD
ncbi:hypothetical protein N7462_003739 [Penicillium macrosclerotiorum]|uniref:uncharacterized protein n=1 Tax=Penicillium macrosclerotiorum TaxID=303699 RepID=UPI00254986F3|nr:uncharacterized protein N7462_003739 [Penicillium macrosclerotiorum]KAJ5689347.1 hypothetical protein N7462_003739 [Penicillium macrosclerotiorum]